MRWSLVPTLSILLLAEPAFAQTAGAGPDALPGQVQGVVGSGSRLSLQLKPEGASPGRILQIGDTFEDGWVLSALTASTATLTKAGVSRTVGLNPGGALSTGAAPIGGATVTVNAPTRLPPSPPGPDPAAVAAARARAVQRGAAAEFDAAQATDQGMRDATVALQTATTALQLATPETRPAAQQAFNQARNGLVAAQDAQIQAHAALDAKMAAAPAAAR